MGKGRAAWAPILTGGWAALLSLPHEAVAGMMFALPLGGKLNA